MYPLEGEVIDSLAQDTYSRYSRHDVVRLAALLIQHKMMRTQDRYSREKEKEKFWRLPGEEGCRSQCRMSNEQAREMDRDWPLLTLARKSLSAWARLSWILSVSLTTKKSWRKHSFLVLL